jgi:site-specific DNA recombinase
MTKKVAIYVRVSTEEQAKEGASLEAQRDYLRLWAEREGWQFVAEYADEGKSGKDIAHRLALQKALQDARGGRWDALLVYHNDRLSRNTEDALAIARTLRKAKKSLLCGNVGLDLSTPEGELMFTNLAAFATYFRRDLGRKTSLGMQRRRAEGKWVGRVSRFYAKDDDGKLHAKDSRVSEALALRGQGKTYAEVGRVLGIPTMTAWRLVRAAPAK